MNRDENEELTYRGYKTIPHISYQTNVIYGKIESIGEAIEFHADTPTEFKEKFEKAVDDYIEFKKELYNEDYVRGYNQAMNTIVKEFTNHPHDTVAMVIEFANSAKVALKNTINELYK